MIERRPFDRLGKAHHGWLNARHHFSFGDYHDAQNMGWGSIRVWNDDEIAPNTGFAMHSHADMEKLQEVGKQVEAAGGQVHCVACDVMEQAQCENLVEESVKAFGGIDMIVNNAGVSMHAWFEDITDLGTFERLFRVNVMSMVWITHKALPHIKKSKGLIVGVSSLAGKTGVPARTTQLAVNSAWAEQWPGSAHLLREETVAWQKTGWAFHFGVGRLFEPGQGRCAQNLLPPM
eukprot:gene9486-12812_t